MTDAQLTRAVATAIGETCRLIRRRGFSLLRELPPDEDVELALDCPGCGAEVSLRRDDGAGLPELAECATCDAAYPYDLDEVNRPRERELVGLR